MREIKFRTWDPFNAVMTYSGKLGLTKFFANYEAAIEGGNEPLLEQFTGLHDNGKDLDWWEGDIFEHPSGKCVIKWYHGGALYARQWWLFSCLGCSELGCAA